MKVLRLCLFGLTAISVTGQSFAYNTCGELRNAYGPYDYRTDTDKLVIVESNHFTPEVETLTRGKSGSLAGDLDYTLRASPNHARALVAMMNLAARHKISKPGGASYSIDCYFDRALRFKPDDGMVRLVFATFLLKSGNSADAVKQLEMARESGMNSANFNYNLGLAYFEVKDYEKSLAAAHMAYQYGFNLPGLKNKLVRAGKWRDPPPLVENAEKTPTADLEKKADAPK